MTEMNLNVQCEDQCEDQCEEQLNDQCEEQLNERDELGKLSVKSTPNATRKNKGMTEQMKRACELLIMKDIHGKSNDDICEELGINRSTLYRWKQRKDFNDYLNDLSEEFHRSFLSEAYSELRKIMLYGKTHEKLKSIELMLKNQGRLKEVRKTTATVEAEVNLDDIFKELGI